MPLRLIPVPLAAILLLAACGGATTPAPVATATPAPVSAPQPTGTPTEAAGSTVSSTAPLWRYVNSGWVSPYGVGQASAFAEELRAFVITSQEELDRFEAGFAMKRSLGTATSLGRIDLSSVILLAAYYLWRPLQGDPLSVEGFSLDGRRAEVFLELEESPQGKEYPLLLAPMVMVAVDRSLFPAGEPVDFVFRLNGEPRVETAVTVD